MRDEAKPVVESDGEREKHTHPAFGVIRLSQTQGGSVSLFGSDIGHMGAMRIEICEAVSYRNLNRDWIHPGRTLVDVTLSHAQWAQFVSSVGGSGTPCTLRRKPEDSADIVPIPGIAKTETKHSVHQREIREGAERAIAQMRDIAIQLESVIDGGRPSVKELRAIAHTLRNRLDNLPENLGFSVESAVEALEGATAAAKSEIESYVNATARRLGLENIQDLALSRTDQARIERIE